MNYGAFEVLYKISKTYKTFIEKANGLLYELHLFNLKSFPHISAYFLHAFFDYSVVYSNHSNAFNFIQMP